MLDKIFRPVQVYKKVLTINSFLHYESKIYNNLNVVQQNSSFWLMTKNVWVVMNKSGKSNFVALNFFLKKDSRKIRRIS